jgi:exopolysaccharide biosynthesis polyprenyl glycosylphosphotransferase
VERSRQTSGKSSQTTPAKPRLAGSPFGPHKSLVGPAGFLKRAIDVSASATGLVVLAPVLAAIAVIVRFTDGGAILYRQVRIGLGGKRFSIIKFRSMSEDAEEQLGAVWSVPSDPRCTRVGLFLRRYGLDELPQLWNVLRGDMSLVGPRPERPEFTRQFRKEHKDYDVRHSVQCGLTGYAQINGWRGYTSLEERVRHDLYYVRNWSIALDLRVLGLTLLRGWSERTRRGV